MTPATLSRLIERAKDHTQAAEQRFAGLQRLVEQARGQLDVLQRYADEYGRRLAPREGELHDPRAHQNGKVFLVRLRQAVEAQEAELHIRQSAAAAAAEDLARCRRKQKSLETLMQRRIDQERKVLTRKEQKETDEFAQRAHERSKRALQGTSDDGGAPGSQPGTASTAQWGS